MWRSVEIYSTEIETVRWLYSIVVNGPLKREQFQHNLQCSSALVDC